MQVTIKTLPALLALAGVLVLGGCAGDDKLSSRPGTLIMREYEFVPKNLTVKAGDLLTVKNDGEIAHNLVIEKGSDPLAPPDKLIGTPTFLGGRSAQLRISLPPGRYEMICSVPGHRQLGQYGSLRVR